MKMKNKYDEQAETFLKKWCVDFKATVAVPQMAPLWAENKLKTGTYEYGTCWSIELIPVDHNKKPIQFFFWNSVAQLKADKQRFYESMRTKPRAYEVLANLYSSDVENFEYFCSSYGYDADSRSAERMYKLCKELNKKIESIFSPEAIEELNEIR